jgi:spore coat protein A, manganese oxidase
LALDVVNLLQPPVIMAAGIPVLLNPLLPASTLVSAPDPVALEFQAYAANLGSAISDEPRRVALFEGQDKYGRLQPLMGTVTASKVQWPTDQVYVDAHLQGGIEGSVSWKGRTPENPVCNTIETWEIWNPTADAHPIHLHLVYFQILERFNIIWDSNTDDEGKLDENRAPQGDGTYLAAQDLVEHGSEAGDPSTLGHGWRLVNATRDTVPVQELVGLHFTGGRRDMVVALPGQVTTIRMKFDKPGRFVWHCHILSHEDHNMMHVIEVQQGTCV